jgi:hypothetical protein
MNREKVQYRRAKANTENMYGEIWGLYAMVYESLVYGIC